MPFPKDISKPRIIAESAIIVASILLALWVDAWWAARQQDIREQSILTLLQPEIAGLRSNIAYSKTYIEAIRSSTFELANIAIQGTGFEQKEKVDQLLGDFIWYVGTDFGSVVVLESLFSTGDIELVKNNDLRIEISQFQLRLNQFRIELRREADYFDGTIVPYLQEHADIAQFHARSASRPGFPEQVYDNPGFVRAEDKSQHDLLRDRDFLNILLHRITTLDAVLWWYESELVDRIGRIEILINQEISSR